MISAKSLAKKIQAETIEAKCSFRGILKQRQPCTSHKRIDRP